MRALLQRVDWAHVAVAGSEVGAIDQGLLILLGIRKGDTPEKAEQLARKIVQLRIFEDESGKMNWDIVGVTGEILVVSQFTLYANVSKGRRPDFLEAEIPEKAKPLITHFCQSLMELGLHVAEGQFGAHMKVSLQNDGPVTLILEA